MKEKCQYFNGKKYTLDEKSGYYLNSTEHKRLHRAVWEYYNGGIPSGYHIHHIDGNKENNHIDNLMMLDPCEHLRLHGAKLTDEQIEWKRENLKKKARPKANEWHGSADGKEWHRQHAKAMGFGKKQIECVCEQCGKPFVAKDTGKNRFCSNKCKTKWRWAAGVDNEKRRCVICGAEYETNKYSRVKTCSDLCHRKLIWRNRRAAS